ncbi:methyltransferase [Streptomyces nanshensis]|nr:methyltransferase [Streptomyces nanshensis]
MGFNYNDHYHPLLLRQLPEGARTALDVGCGAGRFARLLAERGLDTEGVDAHAGAVEQARAAGGGPRYRHADVREWQLPDSHYDFISCIASLHHMPFETLLTLRKALAPGGVLVVLGLYAVRSAADAVWALPGVSLLKADQALGRLRRGTCEPGAQVPLVWPPPLSYAATRTEAARLLPGSTLRRLVFWRYLLVYRAGRDPGGNR